jgi:hypothetical protein
VFYEDQAREHYGSIIRPKRRLIGSGLHRMQILASFELPKFGSEGRPAREGASCKGARPCPQRQDVSRGGRLPSNGREGSG